MLPVNCSRQWRVCEHSPASTPPPHPCCAVISAMRNTGCMYYRPITQKKIKSSGLLNFLKVHTSAIIPYFSDVISKPIEFCPSILEWKMWMGELITFAVCVCVFCTPSFCVKNCSDTQLFSFSTSIHAINLPGNDGTCTCCTVTILSSVWFVCGCLMIYSHWSQSSAFVYEIVILVLTVKICVSQSWLLLQLICVSQLNVYFYVDRIISPLC